MKLTDFQIILSITVISIVGFGSAFLVMDHEQKQILTAKHIVACHDQKKLHDFIRHDPHFNDADRAAYLEKYPDSEDCYTKLGISNPLPDDVRKLVDDPDKLEQARDDYAISRLGVIRK